MPAPLIIGCCRQWHHFLLSFYLCLSVCGGCGRRSTCQSLLKVINNFDFNCQYKVQLLQLETVDCLISSCTTVYDDCVLTSRRPCSSFLSFCLLLFHYLFCILFFTFIFFLFLFLSDCLCLCRFMWQRDSC